MSASTTQSTLHPLRRVSLSAQIAERVREDILSGVHESGAQLHEVELALAFGVSRGPLREALQRLVQEGLLRSEPHKGVFVPELSAKDIRDIFFVRGMVEAAAVRRILEAGERVAAGEALKRIAAHMDKAMKSDDHAHGGDLDFEFHRTLVDAAGSERLSRTYATVQAETRLCLRRLIDGYRQPRNLADEHFRLARMMLDAEPGPLLEELHRHLGDPARALDGILKED